MSTLKTYEEMVGGLQSQLQGLGNVERENYGIGLLILGIQGACWCAERIARAIESSKEPRFR